MFNMEDILARLQDGDDPEAIAGEFTNALNGAINKQREDEAAKNEQHELNILLIAVSGALKAYVEKKYPEVDETLLNKLTDKDSLAELIEGVVVALDALSPLLDAFAKMEAKEEKKPEKIAPRKTAFTFPGSISGTVKLDDDSEIASFLKSFNL